MNLKIITLDTDLLIIGGGTAGCMAAIRAKELDPAIDVLIIEKAHIERSGCLAAGINAINAYLNPGETPLSFLEYVKRDSYGLVRDDLVYSMAQRLNEMTDRMVQWGLPVSRDESGNYAARGKRSIRINGERFKPILADAASRSGAKVLNHTVAADYIVQDGRMAGVFAFNIRKPEFYVIRAKAAICATGGASGIYGPNNGGASRHKMWYSPFNTGAGYAMGIRAGAEMTTFEMRFIALRIKDVIAPTGTLAQGVNAPQINALGEQYLKKYEAKTTAARLYATLQENQQGRGPCYLDTRHLNEEQAMSLKEAYLNMCPGILALWGDMDKQPNEMPLEITGTEPYIVGGHAQAGYWIDTNRMTTIEGLYAAGDVAGGVPKKYVTGGMAEGCIAAESAIRYLKNAELVEMTLNIDEEYRRICQPLWHSAEVKADQLEAYLHKVMDEYAGGIKEEYRLDGNKLLIARQRLNDLRNMAKDLKAADLHDLMECRSVIDRIWVARILVEHLLYRKESRWPVYQQRVDYPDRDDQRWKVFVNSIYDSSSEQIKIIERGYAPYEHKD